MKKSPNQIRVELQAIQEAHDQLNDFFWGSFNRAYNEKNVVYPLMCANIPTGTMFRNTTPVDIYIFIVDKLYKGLSNFNDTESDCMQVARDVFNIINRSERWGRIGRIDSAIFSKAIDGLEVYAGSDEVAGVMLQIKMTLRDSDSICNLPLTDYDMDGSAQTTCEPVQIFENDILVATIPSGGVYSYVVVPGVATVENSDQSYTATVDAGDTLVLPDTEIIVSVNGVEQESITFATLSDQIINITN